MAVLTRLVLRRPGGMASSAASAAGAGFMSGGDWASSMALVSVSLEFTPIVGFAAYITIRSAALGGEGGRGQAPGRPAGGQGGRPGADAAGPGRAGEGRGGRPPPARPPGGGPPRKGYKARLNRSAVSTAVIETNHGTMRIRLGPEDAPETVRNFEKLAGSGFYDGTLFHRIIPGFMIQGGDPNTKGGDQSTWGNGGPGYTIKAEFNARPHKRGAVSMARASDPDSAGSQFFIVTTDSLFLDRQYTAFGEVVEGMDVADKIVALDRDSHDRPLTEARMIRVTISQ